MHVGVCVYARYLARERQQLQTRGQSLDLTSALFICEINEDLV